MSVDQETRRQASAGARLVLAGLSFLLPFAILLVLVTTDTAWLARVDADTGQEVHDLLADHRWLVTANLWLNWIVHPMVLRAIAVVIGTRLWLAGRRRDAVWLVATMATAWILSGVIKTLVGRDRPVFEDPFTIVDGHAFPSGHALSGAAFAGCLLVMSGWSRPGPPRVAVRAAGLVVMVLAGLNRVALGVHYVSDVLAGWLLGGAVVVAIYAMATVLAARPARSP